MQEIEAEIFPLMEQQSTKGEMHLKLLKEKKARLMNRIKEIRSGQMMRKSAIELYLKNARNIVKKKEMEILTEEEEMIAKLIPLCSKIDKQIAVASAEVRDCIAHYKDIKGSISGVKSWKLFKMAAEKRTYSFEGEQGGILAQPEKGLAEDGIHEVPIGEMFADMPQMELLDIDPAEAAIKTEKHLLSTGMNILKLEMEALQEKCLYLRKKIQEIKGSQKVFLKAFQSGSDF